MTAAELGKESGFEMISEANASAKMIKGPFCCDLLSIAMSKTFPDAAWVTVMGNLNTLAVAALTDAACVVIAEGITLDEAVIKKAESEGITVLSSKQPVFETALRIYELLKEQGE